jgi:flagellar basal-body rod modification protein FlgD
MTAIPPIGAIAQSQPAAQAERPLSATTTQTLDYDAFLQLLVAQMENQDPLEPISETEYVAQLASFSNVEQNIVTNDRLSAILTANAIGDSEGLIGRTLTTPEGVSGTVSAVQITADGTRAVLSSGATVPVGEGVTIA